MTTCAAGATATDWLAFTGNELYSAESIVTQSSV
jgi:hypothetical protein